MKKTYQTPTTRTIPLVPQHLLANSLSVHSGTSATGSESLSNGEGTLDIWGNNGNIWNE